MEFLRTSNTMLQRWVQAKWSFLNVQNNTISYVDLDASQIEFLEHMLAKIVQISII